MKKVRQGIDIVKSNRALKYESLQPQMDKNTWSVLNIYPFNCELKQKRPTSLIAFWARCNYLASPLELLKLFGSWRHNNVCCGLWLKLNKFLYITDDMPCQLPQLR